MTPSRLAAFRILLAIVKGRGNSDALLHSAQVTALSAEDRNLTTTLVMGVLRWQISLDVALRQHLSRPDAVIPNEAAISLRLGAFQLLFLERVPVHAAINESVELVKHSAAPHTAGLVNAVLRKIAASGRVLPMNAAERAHPDWLLARWRKNYGDSAAQVICEYDQAVPPLSVRLADSSAESRLRADGVEVGSSSLLRNARVLSAGRIAESSAFMDGLVRVQDEGSQLVAELAGTGEEILDCCAAPGGKTAILAENNPGARVLACDANPERLRTMERLLAKNADLKLITYRQMDSEKLPDDMQERFDLVLCDVPCSGTGTLARNPEIRHRLSIAGVREQQARQVAILRSALQAVKPGGQLLYSTCSLEPEENEDVVTQVLGETSSFTQVDVGQRLTELTTRGRLRPGAAELLAEKAVQNGALHLLPGMFGCDGFFATILERTG
jgi:16S rRNA (cytosine967-C5)-methyltransferase